MLPLNPLGKGIASVAATGVERHPFAMIIGLAAIPAGLGVWAAAAGELLLGAILGGAGVLLVAFITPRWLRSRQLEREHAAQRAAFAAASAEHEREQLHEDEREQR